MDPTKSVAEMSQLQASFEELETWGHSFRDVPSVRRSKPYNLDLDQVLCRVH
jgi:hypothetical protein